MVENERTIGYVWYGPEADASDDRWWLWDIWVNESDRGRGVGREVLALVEAEVRQLHGTSLGLSVLGSNDRARAAVRAIGVRSSWSPTASSSPGPQWLAKDGVLLFTDACGAIYQLADDDRSPCSVRRDGANGLADTKDG